MCTVGEAFFFARKPRFWSHSSHKTVEAILSDLGGAAYVAAGTVKILRCGSDNVSGG